MRNVEQELESRITILRLKGHTDVSWCHGIFNAFSLSLVYVQKPFCIDFYVSFFLFQRSFWARNAKETTDRAYDGPSSLWRYVGGIVVRREAAEGR